MASVIPEQESAEMPATTAEPAADLPAKYSVTIGLDTDTDLAKLQDGVVAIAPIGSNLNCSLSSERMIYTKRQQRKS